MILLKFHDYFRAENIPIPFHICIGLRCCSYNFCWYARPKVKRPKTDRTLSSTGTGFRRRIARGMADPPRTTEAKRLNSTP